ncbi:nitroreductase [Streptomyces litmocidini]|uniref:nitroreductase family deazaflavin-dependent oxidoreductase n=1 Tax=Streptomyces litmocidini TaxID=67318 RepID=UPI00167ECD52|nr:nitroreductase family deazaflavin-dependent oxidoreductase [Streptomyces litmocidini]GGU96280.1 nitroreductase [Streptomyces litmocidini]
MPLEGEYEPSPTAWVRKQVELYESSGGTEGTTMRGLPVVLVTSLGSRSGKLRKTPLMRVEHEGSYALVASNGGAVKHPVWYHNLVATPLIELRDGPHVEDMKTRLVTGGERRAWWERAVAAFPDYADYQRRADREIPLFVAEPVVRDV